MQERAGELAALSDRPAGAKGVALTPLVRTIDAGSIRYEHVEVAIDRAGRSATITLKAPGGAQPADVAAIEAAGADWYPLQMARQLDDAILHAAHQRARARHLDPEDRGDVDAVLGDGRDARRAQGPLVRARDDRPAAPHAGAPRRLVALAVRADRARLVLRRHASLELALAADRSYMLALPDEPEPRRSSRCRRSNFGAYPMVSDETRLAAPLLRRPPREIDAARAAVGRKRSTPTPRWRSAWSPTAPDDIDWDDEIRIALEERASLSPDALTGLEANLRFAGAETMETRIFGRLTAWQNWIFIRPNAVGEGGALKVYGTGDEGRSFDRKRV